MNKFVKCTLLCALSYLITYSVYAFIFWELAPYAWGEGVRMIFVFTNLAITFSMIGLFGTNDERTN